MKRSEIVKVLEAMRDNCHGMAKTFAEKGNKEAHDRYVTRACELSGCIGMLTNDKFANEMKEIFLKHRKEIQR